MYPFMSILWNISCVKTYNRFFFSFFYNPFFFKFYLETKFFLLNFFLNLETFINKNYNKLFFKFAYKNDLKRI